MQEEQVTIGGTSYPVPTPFIVMATQNPIESEGTYPLPEAQVDRFLMKILVDYPSPSEEAAVVGRSLAPAVSVRECLTLADLELHGQAAATVTAGRDVIAYAVSLADATRNPATYGIAEIGAMIEFGASPRGPIGLVQAARALALLRGRGHIEAQDIRDLAADVLRHRLVLSYDALSDGVTANQLLERVLAAVPGAGCRSPVGGRRELMPDRSDSPASVAPTAAPLLRPPAAARRSSAATPVPARGPPGPGPDAERVDRRARPGGDAAGRAHAGGGRRALGVGSGMELLQLRPYQPGDEVRHIDAAASARTGRLHVRLHVPERSLTTWLVLDLSPAMAFGTARRLKADVAEGVALVFARLGVRRAGNIGVVGFGAGGLRLLPPRGARLGMVALAAAGAGCRARRNRRRPARAGAGAHARGADRPPTRARRGRLGPARPAAVGAAAGRAAGSSTRPSWSRSPTRASTSCRRSGGWRWSTPRAAT